MQRRANRPAVAAALVLATLACGSQPSARAARPTPSPIGRAADAPAIASIDAAGGHVSSADGLLRVDVLLGAVSASTSFTVDEVLTNSSPGARGKAYRLGPEGIVLAQPVVLTFDAAAAGVSASELPGTTVAYQDASGFWLRVPGVTYDVAAGTISVATTHFSDWSLVGSDPSRDLSGGFSIVRTLAGADPMTFTGTAILSYAGEDELERWYLQGGTIAIMIPAGCTASPAALRTNIAEVTNAAPPTFEWGVSAHLSMSCVDWAGPVDLVFDTVGINDFECTHTAAPGNIAAVDHVAGSYTIDCGGGRTLTATWNFVPP